MSHLVAVRPSSNHMYSLCACKPCKQFKKKAKPQPRPDHGFCAWHCGSPRDQHITSQSCVERLGEPPPRPEPTGLDPEFIDVEQAVVSMEFNYVMPETVPCLMEDRYPRDGRPIRVYTDDEKSLAELIGRNLNS